MEIDLAEDGFVVHGWIKMVVGLYGNGKDSVEWELSN
jgi:hypothetical protein